MKTDVELVQDVRDGNQELGRRSFSELVSRHQRALLRLSLRFTREQSLAEDIVQEAFIKAFQKLHLFEGRSSFKSWLYQIALNTARNKYRDPRNRMGGENAFDFVNIDDLPLGTEPGAETDMVKADVKRFIRQEVERLPERQKIALTLRIFEDLSFKEIAEIMDCPYDTAKANYRHALLKLKERIHASDGLSEDLSPLLQFSKAMGEAEL